jgi:hypothetical protein
LTRKWEAADECGNADTCTQVITVEDTTAPSFVDCPADITVECNAIPTPASPSATDNCDASVAVSYLGQVSTPGACPQSYMLTRKWEASDNCGNKDTCTQIITVQDTTPPSFVDCPADITVECNAIPTAVSPSATDNCGAVTVTYLGEVSTPGACPNSYTLTRKWEAADECGNADTCTQVITVEDTTAPSFVDCPADITVECNAIPAPASPTATDNCGAATVTYLGETMNAGNCPYTLTRKWEAVDACGNADTCTQIITVQDTQAPVCENVPTDVTVECSNIPGVGTPGAVDNCDPNPTVTYLGEVITPGACPQSYTITRSWEAKDGCGNADTCSQTITVVDTTAPIFVDCPADITVECDAIPTPASPSATDNCGAVTVTYLGETSTPGACPQSYNLTRKWEAADECGNADTCTQVITVEDTTPPVIGTCPQDATVECDNIPAVGSPNGITDNCDPSPSLIYLGETTVAGACPNSYSLIRKWIAVDACGNESDTCTQTITVVDTTAPIFVDCPADATVSCDNIPTVTDPKAVDSCDNNPTVTFLGEEVVNGSCPYFIIRRWEAKDACGNADTCEQTLTVIDNIAPVIDSCPANITVECGNVPSAATVTASDNCTTNPPVTYLGESSAPGACPQSYTLVRKWVAHDNCGNSSDTCVQVITVLDTMPPTINDCPANATVQCNAVPLPSGPSNITDNCDPNPQVTFLGEITTAGSCPQSYTLLRKWIAIDACGNKSDTCRQVITVIDTIKPYFVNCPSNATVQCNAIPAPATPMAADTCDPDPVETYLGETVTPGSCPSHYTLTRKWIATDACGNKSDTCRQVITVTDTTTLSLGADSTKSFGTVCQPLSGNFKLRNATSCGPLYWRVNNVPASQDTTIPYSAGYCTNFNQTWTISVTDSCGRSDSYTVTISANVNCLPQASCPTVIADPRFVLLVSWSVFQVTDLNVVTPTAAAAPH